MIREKLASYAHNAWAGWMKYLFSKCYFDDKGRAIIPKWAVDRWYYQISKKYDDLPEEMKKSDLDEADKILKIVSLEGKK